MAAIACVLALSAGCESIDIPPVSRDKSSGQPGIDFVSSGNSTVDAYDLIVYDRIDRKWRAMLDTLTSLSEDYKKGIVKVIFRLHQDGRITGLEIVAKQY